MNLPLTVVVVVGVYQPLLYHSLSRIPKRTEECHVPLPSPPDLYSDSMEVAERIR